MTGLSKIIRKDKYSIYSISRQSYTRNSYHLMTQCIWFQHKLRSLPNYMRINLFESAVHVYHIWKF